MRYRQTLLLICSLFAAGILPAAEKGAEFTVGSFVFAVPKGWQMGQPSSALRKAELKASDEKTKAVAETVFFYFGPGQGGGAAENVARWKGQVTDLSVEKVEEKNISGTKLTLVKFEGNYQSGMPGGPKVALAESTLLGAILESPGGNVFVRLTGPSAWVKTLENDFVALVEAGAKNKRG